MKKKEPKADKKETGCEEKMNSSESVEGKAALPRTSTKARETGVGGPDKRIAVRGRHCLTEGSRVALCSRIGSKKKERLGAGKGEERGGSKEF